ncbi:hypothetical protein LEP1GSC060_2583 [Leptospira weilii serovar Ranarum str. ICFT]|uniref:Uncharacterized protein n=1 Tax=Leptospira weilii serovar Ranarum str. ICFT TaxID=1218598 RepID=N1WUC3_9LEPT|nr:hypothetical protein [Leptospira weilii]EMY79443.1 hypothetical protein LEP1GSC060_2583 [Leptospira weilii serovar Ranarum str. ICFT]
MRAKDLKQTDEEIEKAILEGINGVNDLELNHSEVYDPYVILNAIDKANDFMAEFNRHGLSPKDLIESLRRNSD